MANLEAKLAKTEEITANLEEKIAETSFNNDI